MANRLVQKSEPLNIKPLKLDKHRYYFKDHQENVDEYSMIGPRKILIILFILVLNSSCGVKVTESGLVNNPAPPTTSLPEGLYLVSQRDIKVTNYAKPSDISAISASGDGRFIAFISRAPIKDFKSSPNGSAYLVDTLTGEINLITKPLIPLATTMGDLYEILISNDGSKVALTYEGLVDLDVTSGTLNNSRALLLYDVSAMNLDVVSNDVDYQISISSTGRKIAFISTKDLPPNDTNDLADVFIFDSQDNSYELASLSTSGTQSDGGYFENLSLSGDGTTVSFITNSTNLDDKFPITRSGILTAYTRTLASAKTWALTAQGLDTTYPGEKIAFAGNGESIAFSFYGQGGQKQINLRNLRSGELIRVDVDQNGDPTGNSFSPSISYEGRYVAFHSYTSNLVLNDGNADYDVFVRDLESNQTSRVSVSSSGAEGNGYSGDAYVSSTGRFITFSSTASNLVISDTNNMADVFLHDRNTAETSRVSLNINGDGPNAYSTKSSVTADGQFIVFESEADDIVSNDNNGEVDIFVYNRTSNVTRKVSVSSSGLQANGPSADASISDDGRYIVFRSDATNLVDNDSNGEGDIFLHDSSNGITIRVSDGQSYGPKISPDGRYITFQSSATNLVAGDTNSSSDIFRYEVSSGNIIRISMNTQNSQSNSDSSDPVISADGSKVVFYSSASNLVNYDSNGKMDLFIRDILSSTTEVAVFSKRELDQSVEQVKLNNTGDQLYFQTRSENMIEFPTSDGGASDVYRLRLDDSYKMEHLSTYPADQTETFGDVSLGNVSLDGSAYEIRSTQQLTSDGNPGMPFYVYSVDDAINYRLLNFDQDGNFFDLNPKFVTRLNDDSYYLKPHESLIAGITDETGYGLYHFGLSGFTPVEIPYSNDLAAYGSSNSGSVSDDGKYVAFTSESSHLVENDFNNSDDIFLRDLNGRTTSRISVARDGGETNAPSIAPEISGDGNFVAFLSQATNIVSEANTSVMNIYLHNRQDGSTSWLSKGFGNSQPNEDATSVSLCSSGEFIAFSSHATNLTSSSDTNGDQDIFIINKSSPTIQNVAQGFAPKISGNCNYITFTSNASNLVDGDTNGVADVFVYERSSGLIERVSVGNLGAQADNGSYESDISSDGRWVVFSSNARNLISGDSNGFEDIFLRDRLNAVTKRISISLSGPESNADSSRPRISSEGRYIVFDSEASNLISGDSNGVEDVFIYDRISEEIKRVSISDEGREAGAASEKAEISGNGKSVLFFSESLDLLQNSSRKQQLYLRQY